MKKSLSFTYRFFDIESKNKIISKLSIIKDKYTYELKTIYIKLQKI